MALYNLLLSHENISFKSELLRFYQNYRILTKMIAFYNELFYSTENCTTTFALLRLINLFFPKQDMSQAEFETTLQCLLGAFQSGEEATGEINDNAKKKIQEFIKRKMSSDKLSDCSNTEVKAPSAVPSAHRKDGHREIVEIEDIPEEPCQQEDVEVKKVFIESTDADRESKDKRRSKRR